jgi:predicted TIM-barrel fold metal-dependent hydrolase
LPYLRIKQLALSQLSFRLKTALPGIVFAVLFVLTGCGIMLHSDQPPFADIHLHYNYTHAEVIDVKDVLKKLKQNNVVLASVSSEPTDYALKIADAGGSWIIPFATPYYKSGNRLNWYFDENLVNEIRSRLQTGRYGGIGEVHLTAGIGPARNNPVFTGLLDLAREFNLPFLIHTDTSNYRYFLPICNKYTDIRFIWAHAGGTFQPDQLEPLMQACANVWLDLAGRDPEHYGDLADDQGVLFPGWREFIIQYQDRIMTGTDPVWNAHQIYRWYEADEGWDHYDDFIRFHRNWLKQLPATVEKKVRLTNAQDFFNKP